MVICLKSHPITLSREKVSLRANNTTLITKELDPDVI